MKVSAAAVHGIRAEADEGGAVEDHEELDQERRALEELDVALRQPS